MSEEESMGGQIEQLYALLANFPSKGKLPNDDTTISAIRAGLIELCGITKPCRTCGTLRPDHSYFRVTAAGKLFVEAFLHSAPSSSDTGTGSTVGEREG